jgi:hypothetical protein
MYVGLRAIWSDAINDGCFTRSYSPDYRVAEIFRDNDVTAGVGFYAARRNCAENIEIFDRRAPVAKQQEFAKAGLPVKMARAPIDSRSRIRVQLRDWARFRH